MERREVDGKGRHYIHPVTAHKMPSVTNVLSVIAKPLLIPWAAKVERELVTKYAGKVHAELNGDHLSAGDFEARLLAALPRKKAHATKLSDASDIGSEAHSMIEWRLRGELGMERGPEPVISEPAMWAVAGWEDFRKEASLKTTHTEVRLYSEDLDAAGATDAICCELETPLYGIKRRIFAIADWKSSKAIYPEMEIQVAAYWFMAIERGLADEKAWGLVLRLPKTLEDPKFEARLIPPSRCRELVDVFRAARRIWKWMHADKETR